jgi:hypothetical protein
MSFGPDRKEGAKAAGCPQERIGFEDQPLSRFEPVETPDGVADTVEFPTSPIHSSAANCSISGEESAPNATQHQVRCHVDGGPCDLASGLTPGGVAKLKVVRDLMVTSACAECREPLAHAAHLLDGGRLGQRARYVLLHAAPAGTDPIIVPPKGSTPADREAHRRTIRALTAAGLVRIAKKKTVVMSEKVRRAITGQMQPVRSRQWVKAVVRTRLGQALVELRDDLRDGQGPVIRWKHLGDGVIARVQPTPSHVRGEFVRRLRRYLEKIRGDERGGYVVDVAKRDAAAAVLQIFDGGNEQQQG